MGMWLYPTIFVCIVLCLIGYYLTVKVGHKIEHSGEERDSEVPDKIIEHPFLLNPIVLSYAVFLAFTGIIIFYYWARGY
ncbi:short-chain dehydrogenase [Solibacillus daqui]|uniref:short-chain dehydrogenase n=1 Tax=Solibacillus daqui TaxID=2912187 RepID=UPI002365C242|nr:short-chain dehydrogenase [Solibacillus daqui]